MMTSKNPGKLGIFGFRNRSNYAYKEIWIANSTAIASGGDGGQVRGLGWQLASSPGCSAGQALPGVAFGHTGFTGTSVWVDPRRQAVFVLLTNRHHPGHHEVDLHPLRRCFHALAAADLTPTRS
jgi:CubicO group peptidase (beta-lactamase class C family)